VGNNKSVRKIIGGLLLALCHVLFYEILVFWLFLVLLVLLVVLLGVLEIIIAFVMVMLHYFNLHEYVTCLKGCFTLLFFNCDISLVKQSNNQSIIVTLNLANLFQLV